MNKNSAVIPQIFIFEHPAKTPPTDMFFSSPYFYYVTIGLQAFCAVHCIRKGNQQKWIWIIVFLPLLGGLIYIFSEVLPHRGSLPSVKVDVGALTETLFESELFGHKKGSFTDAREDRIGRFEAAGTGTLFLDEISNISLHQQAKLLTVLQNRQVTRLGTNDAIPIDIRLICATNVPLSDLANENRFRKDLVYRINTVEIIVPPLRKRGSDIILLAKHFSRIYSNKYLKPGLDFDEKALEKLLHYHYPGNIRELQYTIERAVIMCDGTLLQARDLIFSPIESAPAETPEPTELKLSAIEKNTILRVIEKHNGNITKAAKELGLTRTALYRRLSKYDI